ncbi:MAG: polyribonucleotide nucleotidyltransferase, partial [Gammaproteobacteria bacterium]
MGKIIKEIPFGDHTLRIETGEVARQASAAVIISAGETMLLVTAVGKKEAAEGRDFFPLTVNYLERYYAAGKIPGGFLKREGRPSEYETLTSRLIDRPIRPLFPKGFLNEVQVIAKVLSFDPEVPSDVLAIIGASAALSISGMPFDGPIAAARVGYKDGVYLMNPDKAKIEESQLDLVVAGSEDAILMVESEAKELSEQIMSGAILFGHEMMQPVIRMIKELADEVGNPPWEWVSPPVDEALFSQVQSAVQEGISEAYNIKEKASRYDKLSELRQQLVEKLTADSEEVSVDKITGYFSQIEKKIVRNRILSGTPRIDGRDNQTVRPITIRTPMLPRVHGSALFTRGETQAIVAVTLGNDRDAQIIDAISGDRRDRFMLHYNFPPYCVGETGMMFGPKRREIGHGRLARRGLEAVLPSEDECPYVLRIVSEITESNGSSSMATVCGASMALMDAGIPIKSAVAGIAMGLVKEGDQYVVLTDILGDEDHLG